MKNLVQVPRILIVSLILFSLSGCLDIYFRSEIHPNGNIDKTIILEGDSTSIPDCYIPALTDPTWKSKWENLDEDKHRLTLTKSFKNYRDFNISMNPDDSLPKIRMVAQLHRKFRWFFSYIQYKETLLPNNPFDRLDWQEFLTADELELISMDEEEREADPRYIVSHWSETESQFERYLFRSGFEEFFHYFKIAAENTPDSKITGSLLDKQEEVIYDSLFSKGNLEDTDDFLEHFRSALDSTAVNLIVNKNPEIFDYFGTKIDFFNESLSDNYYFSIKMPGLLIDTNSAKIEGSTLSWEVDFFDFYFRGLDMTAESRVINIWAFVVAGVVVLSLFIGLLLNLFRRK